MRANNPGTDYSVYTWGMNTGYARGRSTAEPNQHMWKIWGFKGPHLRLCPVSFPLQLLFIILFFMSLTKLKFFSLNYNLNFQNFQIYWNVFRPTGAGHSRFWGLFRGLIPSPLPPVSPFLLIDSQLRIVFFVIQISGRLQAQLPCLLTQPTRLWSSLVYYLAIIRAPFPRSSSYFCKPRASLTALTLTSAVVVLELDSYLFETGSASVKCYKKA